MQFLLLAQQLKKALLSAAALPLYMQQILSKAISDLLEIRQSVFVLFARHAMSHFVGLLRTLDLKAT